MSELSQVCRKAYDFAKKFGHTQNLRHWPQPASAAHCCLLAANELERLEAEAEALGWILGHCELRDRDNTHVDIDDVYAALAEEKKAAAERKDDGPE